MTDDQIFKTDIITTKNELEGIIDQAYEEDGILLNKSGLDLPSNINNSNENKSCFDLMVKGLDDDMIKIGLQMREESMDPIDSINDIITIQKLRASHWLEKEFEYGTPSEDLQAILQHISQMEGQRQKIQDGIQINAKVDHTLIGLIDQIDEDEDYDDDYVVPIIEAEYEEKD